ncbi:AraC family transcriptional regulator [Pseudomonas lalucatii]|uniref:AraC family transcriptional regulator n=1 Tax=Pseudomonas lalucatii TaxID=1424203 RepID=A0ABS5Q1S3_9PSED|nr:AraC family transcriptional regulator [Pseudomonas lalucatii]MBS7662696.1 AraC family transcriptional regulator [Pseudomonas lalucatii]
MSKAIRATTPRFWRDPALPFVEAREVLDGRRVCYARHAHETFSIGAITQGRSTYLNEKARERVGAGSLVLMNPGDVHACNPIEGEPWSYLMFYVDVAWLTELQHQLGFDRNQPLRAFAAILSQDPGLHAGLTGLYRLLDDPQADTLGKHCALLEFFTALQQRLEPAPAARRADNPRIQLAAEFIRDHCTEPLKLEEICAAAGLSPSYLTRSFRRRYGMTPHAYLVNSRIQYAQARLRRGGAIAEVALAAGFADQAHLQRTFKQLLAATPGQYRRAG